MAQSASAGVTGVVTTDTGAVLLPGVAVDLIDQQGERLATVTTDGQGRFRFESVTPGTYRLRASLASFGPHLTNLFTIAPGQIRTETIDLGLGLTEDISVVGSDAEAPQTGSSEASVDGRMIDVAPVAGDDYQALLPLLPGVVRGADGRISLKGGRPTETGLQVTGTFGSDPTVGAGGLGLPVDAVSTVEVQPNPYAAEFGRFSAGVTRVETRRGGRTWSATANNVIPVPCLKLCDGESLGVRAYNPRLIVSGPLGPRLTLAQSLQYHQNAERVPSLPDGEADTSIRAFESFSRFDADAGRHHVTGTAAFFQQNLGFVGLDTFHPQATVPDVDRRGFGVTFEDAITLGARSALEVTFSHTRLDVTVDHRGAQVMTLTPDGARDGFFNEQERRSQTTQWIGTYTAVADAVGEHVLRTGLDVLDVSFEGTSASLPVEIRRADGSLAERLVFPVRGEQRAEGVDVAFFVQDRWRVNHRLVLELGARADRDGVTRRTAWSPRGGFVLGLRADGRTLVRGGAGRFVGRTPLLAGAFESIEAPVRRRFGPDGTTPLGPETAFAHRTGPLRPASSTIWNLELDQRITEGLLLKLNHLRRRGRHELIVEPLLLATGSVIELASRGTSRYRETELTVQYTGDGDRELTVSYVRSRSESDLNGFDTYYGTRRKPILRANEHGLTAVDVPNRLVVLGVQPIGDWLISPLFEIRDGFPYSVIDEHQDFVGARNMGGRFPVFWSLDLNVSRTVRLLGRQVRVGFRSNHLLGNATPRDVQANIGSPAFGTFYNSLVRRLGITVEIRP